MPTGPVAWSLLARASSSRKNGLPSPRSAITAASSAPANIEATIFSLAAADSGRSASWVLNDLPVQGGE